VAVAGGRCRASLDVEQDFPKAAALLREAVAIDPLFAEACRSGSCSSFVDRSVLQYQTFERD
jgi:hypothetical protein